ncbi:hypothetical protein ACI2OX_18610 [Bacillus sp. N9]
MKRTINEWRRTALNQEGNKKLNIFKFGTFTVLFSISLLLLTGCWDRMETNDLAIVTAAGIDKADDGQIELSIQIFIPRATGSGSEGAGSNSGGKETMVMSHKGKISPMHCQNYKPNCPVKCFGNL